MLIRTTAIAFALSACALLSAGTPAEACAWKIIATPLVDMNAFFSGVSGTAANDVWAVGRHHATVNSPDNPLAEHRNGIKWSVIPTPPSNDGALRSVSALTASDAWAVGQFVNGTFRGLTEHWDGKSWKSVPDASGSPTLLAGVKMISHNDVWADGFNLNNGTTVTEHWNGSKWTHVPSPTPPNTFDDQLLPVTATASNDVWAVGNLTLSSGSRACWRCTGTGARGASCPAGTLE